VEDLGNVPGTRALRASGPAANRRSVSWVVKTKAGDASASLEVVSEKGGAERRTIALK
jgi:hypothetical protein